MRNILIILAALATINGLASDDGSFYESYNGISPDTFIDVGHNGITNINNELADPAVRAVAAKSLAIDIQSASQPEYKMTRYNFVCVRNDANAKIISPLTLRMYWYAISRAEGHSEAYALAALSERGTNDFSSATRPKDVILHQHQDVPPSWLRQSPDDTNRFFVTDGDIAWFFSPVEVEEDFTGIAYAHFHSTVCDASEIDPKNADAFQSARAEANAILEERGIKGQLGSVHTYWTELKRILNEKYGIEWRSPAELNRSTQFD